MSVDGCVVERVIEGGGYANEIAIIVDSYRTSGAGQSAARRGSLEPVTTHLAVEGEVTAPRGAAYPVAVVAGTAGPVPSGPSHGPALNASANSAR